MTITSVAREKNASDSTLSSMNDATVQAYCRALRLPTVGGQFERLAHDAVRANKSHTSYLASLLGAEVEERERHAIERRIKEARLPRFKTSEEFGFAAAPHIPAPLIHSLAEGTYLNQAEPVLLIGQRHGQDASGHGFGNSCLLTKEASAFCDRCRSGQRAGGSAAP